MEITFLGTGAGIPSKERNVTGIILNLIQEANQLWLFDCGEATQHQILHTALKPRKISKIFITHLHGDHIFGLPGLLSSRSFLGGNDTLIIYGPTGIKQYVETSLKISDSHLSYPIEYVEFEQAGIIYEDESFLVEVTALNHRIESFGFSVTEKEKPGELHVTKLKALGIMPGPIYRQIKENECTVTTDGQVIHRKDFLGEPKRGKKVVIFGDTTYMPTKKSFIQHANLLVHEATFDANKNDLAKNYYHSTTTEAATLAKDAEVKMLILTHISSRYQGEDEKQLAIEAQTIFPNTTIAEDFYTYKIK